MLYLISKQIDKSGFVEGHMFLEIYNSFRMEMNSGTILGYFLQAIPITIVVGMQFAD